MRISTDSASRCLRTAARSTPRPWRRTRGSCGRPPLPLRAGHHSGGRGWPAPAPGTPVWWKSLLRTSVPTRMRSVPPAAAASETSADGSAPTWSPTWKMSKPRYSAIWARPDDVGGISRRGLDSRSEGRHRLDAIGAGARSGFTCQDSAARSRGEQVTGTRRRADLRRSHARGRSTALTPCLPSRWSANWRRTTTRPSSSRGSGGLLDAHRRHPVCVRVRRRVHGADRGRQRRGLQAVPVRARAPRVGRSGSGAPS